MAWKCVKIRLSQRRQHSASGRKCLKCNYLHNHTKISLAWFVPYCSHCMSLFPISILQKPHIKVFYCQKTFTILSGCPICCRFFRLPRPPHLCKTHAHTLVTRGRMISAFRWSETQSMSTWGWKESISTFWPVASASLQQRDSALIRRHNVWELWRWTELTANYRSLPAQSERALEPSRELLDFEKCLLSLASPVTVTLL